VDCKGCEEKHSNTGTTTDVQISTPTQQPTNPWSSLLRQRPRQCLTLQLTQQGCGKYQELSCSLSLSIARLINNHGVAGQRVEQTALERVRLRVVLEQAVDCAGWNANRLREDGSGARRWAGHHNALALRLPRPHNFFYLKLSQDMG